MDSTQVVNKAENITMISCLFQILLFYFNHPITFINVYNSCLAKKQLDQTPQKNNNLVEDLGTNDNVTNKKKISVISIRTFFIFYPMSTITTYSNVITFSSIKTENNQNMQQHQSLLYDCYLAYKTDLLSAFNKLIHCIRYWFIVLC